MQIVPNFANRYARNITEAQFPSLWRGLVGLWMPSVGIQGSLFCDFSGSRNDAGLRDVTGSPWPYYAGNKGKRGVAVALSGRYGYVAAPRRAAITGDISILAWALRTSNGYACIFAKGNDANNNWDYLLLFSTANKPNFGSTSGPNWLSTSAITDTAWHHIAVTRIGSAWSIYIDGKVDATGTDATAFNNNAFPLLIGAQSVGSNTSGLVGVMDDIRLYNRGLSPQEVTLSAAGYSPLTLRNDSRMSIGKAIAAAADSGIANRFFLLFQ